MTGIFNIIRRDWWILVIMTVTSLTPLLWFHPGQMITGADLDFSPYPIERFWERTATWYHGTSGGADRSNNVASLPFIAPTAIAAAIGFDTVMAEKLTFIWWLWTIGLSIYGLMLLLRQDLPTALRQPATLSAVVLYQCNFYLVFIWTRLQTSIGALILLPVALALLLALNRRQISLAGAALIMAITSLATGAIGIQPPHIMIIAAALAVMVGWEFIWVNRGVAWRRRWSIIGHAAFITAVWIATSLWWMLPLVSFIVQAGYDQGTVGREVYAVDSLLEWVGSITSTLNIIRQHGDVVWFDSWGEQRYAPEFIPYQNNFWLVISSFVIPLIVTAAFWCQRRWRHPLFWLFGGLWLGGIVLSQGTHLPFGVAYQWLIDQVPLFWIQRAPWQKFGLLIALATAVLGGMAVAQGYEWCRRLLIARWPGKAALHRLILGAGVIVVAIWFGWYHQLFILGRMFPDSTGEIGFHQKYNLGFHHAFPDYLTDARQWIAQQPGTFKIFLLPDDKTNVYDWTYAGAADVTPYLFQQEIINRQYGEGFSPPQSVEQISQTAVKDLYADATNSIAAWWQLLGVRYVLQRNDFVYDFYGDTDSPEFIADRLAHQSAVSLVQQSGPWDFYEVADPYPAIYLPTSVGVTSAGPAALAPLLGQLLKSRSVAAPAFVFQADEAARRTLKDIPMVTELSAETFSVQPVKATEQVVFTHTHPTQYRLTLRQVTKPVVVATTINYHADWRLVPTADVMLADDDCLAQRGSSWECPAGRYRPWWPTLWSAGVNNHFAVNGYANGWVVDPTTVCEQTPSACQVNPAGGVDMTLVIDFWPQYIFWSGCLISGLALLLVIAWWLGRKVWKK